MTPKEVLIAARGLIDTPGKWTKGSSARRADGAQVTPFVADACTFCASGAIMRATTDGTNEDYSTAVSALRKHIPIERWGVACYNDDASTTHADMLKLFDKAIASCP